MKFQSRWSLLVLFALFWIIPANGQVPVQIAPVARQKFTDSNGNPLVGGQVFTYQSGTTTPLATYTDNTGTVQNSNPIILDATGSASIWLVQQCYKVIVEDSFGAVQYSQDGICLPPFLNGNNAWTGNETHTGTETFNGSVAINSGGSVSGIFSGNPTFSGNATFSGTIHATGAPPFTVLDSTLVTNLNVNDINGAIYPAAAALYSVPVTTVAPITATGITAAVVNAVGSGFNVGDLLAVTGGGGSGAILQVATVSSGAIATFNVLSGGSGYTTTTGATLSELTGSGSGAPTANVTVGGTALQGAVSSAVLPNCSAFGNSLTFSEVTHQFGCNTNSGFKIEYVGSSPVTVANTMSETPLMSFSLPANELTSSQVLRLAAAGVYSTVGAGVTATFTFKVKADGLVLASLSTADDNFPVTGANDGWRITLDVICATAGSSGTVESQGDFFTATGVAGTTPTTIPLMNAATLSLDTTVAHTISVSVTMTGLAPSPDVYTVQRQFIAERLN